MSDAELPSAEAADGPTVAAPRKRPKPGERRLQILQALATMLERPDGERITTAALAARLEVSEAALYRHFASKAQMFEGLIEFIEHSVFSLIQQIHADDTADDTAEASTAVSATDAVPPCAQAQARRQIGRTLTMLLQFAEQNPGMVRVMVGDALVFENERLQLRMNQFFDKIESSLRQTLREAASAEGTSPTPTVDAQVQASVLTSFLLGRLQRFARSGFKRWPTEHLEASLARLL